MSSELCKYMRKRKVTDSDCAAQTRSCSVHPAQLSQARQEGLSSSSDYTLLDLSWCVQRHLEQDCLI